MRATLILNPVSGDKEPNSQKVGDIRQMLGPLELDVRETAPEQEAGTIAREAVQAGAKVVLVGGGDGTVSEVARALVHQDTTLGILPIGTFNNIARSLDIPADLSEACRIIVQGGTRAIDVGLANDDHYFFEAAGAGLNATLFPIGEEIKGGKWTRLWEAAKLTWQFQEQRFRLGLDGRVIKRRALLVVGANGPFYGGGFTVAPGARLADGRLTLSIYRDFSKWELFRHFRSISQGRYRYSQKIEALNARELTIDAARPIPVHVDGKPYGETPVRLRAVPAALRVFAPGTPARDES